MLAERSLSAAEKKKKEEIVLAIKRDNPNMPEDKMYAIATAKAKQVAESLIVENQEEMSILAAQALLAGFKSFVYRGREYPVEISLEQAKQILDAAGANVGAAATQSVDQFIKSTDRMIRGARNINIMRNAGSSIMFNIKEALENPEVQKRIMKYLTAAGLTGVSIAALAAVAIGGRFAWRNFLSPQARKQKKFARMLANDEALRRELNLNVNINLDTMGVPDSEAAKEVIHDIEKIEIRSGI